MNDRRSKGKRIPWALLFFPCGLLQWNDERNVSVKRPKKESEASKNPN